jgi:hypothetical protein
MIISQNPKERKLYFFSVVGTVRGQNRKRLQDFG